MGFPTDQDLWTAAASRKEAIGVLYERHAEAVYAHCVRRLGDWARAEDLTSGVFLLVVRRPRKLRFYEGSALPWLLATAQNLERNDARSRWRSRRRERAVASESFEPDFSSDSDTRVERLARLEHARYLVGQLAQADQDVFVLHVSGLSYDEIAFALSIPLGTVKSRLARARRELARHADPTDDHEPPALHAAREMRRDTP